MKNLLRTPWYYGWNIVAAGMAAQAVVFGLTLYGFTFWIGHWTEDFGVSRSEVMVIFLLVQIAGAFFSPIGGRAIDRYPIRRLMLVSGASFAVALSLSAFATRLWQIGVVYGVFMVVGMIWGGSLPAGTLVARWFGRRRGMAMGLSTIGSSIGGLVIPPLIAHLQSEYGWRDANHVLAALAFGIIGFAALIVSNSPREAGVEHEGGAEDGSDSEDGANAHEWTAPEILRSRAFWAMGISFALLSVPVSAIQQNIAPLGQDAGIEPTRMSWFVSTMAGVMILSKLGIGSLADRINHTHLLYVVLLLIALGLTILASFEPGEGSLLAAVVVLGVGVGGILPLLGMFIARIFGPESFGRVKGMVYLVMLPASLGAVIAAAIYDASGSYRMAWIVVLVLLTPAAFLIRRISPEGAPVASPAEAAPAAATPRAADA